MSNFRQSLIPFAFAFVLIATVRPVLAQGQPGVKPASDVNVVNTPTVNSKQSGPWSLGINPAENTVKVDSSTPIPVRAVEQPYSVYIYADGFTPHVKTCTEIPVQGGKRFLLEAVTVNAFFDRGSDAAAEAFVRQELPTAFATQIDDIQIPLTKPLFAPYSGHLQTRILTGAMVDTMNSSVGTMKLSLCAGPGTIVKGAVTGTLLPQ